MADPVKERIASLRALLKPVRVVDGECVVDADELEWILDRHDWAIKALAEQQRTNNEAYANGKKLGYELGLADGYERCLEDQGPPEGGP